MPRRELWNLHLLASKNKPISKFMNEKWMYMYLRTFRKKKIALNNLAKQKFSNGRHDNFKWKKMTFTKCAIREFWFMRRMGKKEEMSFFEKSTALPYLSWIYELWNFVQSIDMKQFLNITVSTMMIHSLNVRSFNTSSCTLEKKSLIGVH